MSQWQRLYLYEGGISDDDGASRYAVAAKPKAHAMTRHTTTIAVRFYELDPYDHVNHAVYLSYFETARIEALESVGMGLHSLAERGFRIVVSDLTLKFHAPAKAGDLLEIETFIVDMKRVTHGWRQDMWISGIQIASLDLRAAMTNLDGRPTRIPPFFRGAWSGE